jgi:hypothetical protein
MVQDDYPFDDLPYDDDIPDRGIAGRQAITNLLNNEALLTDEQFKFVTSCSRFVRLSQRQEQALVDTWHRVEMLGTARRARLQRRQQQRRRTSDE